MVASRPPFVCVCMCVCEVWNCLCIRRLMCARPKYVHSTCRIATTTTTVAMSNKLRAHVARLPVALFALRAPPSPAKNTHTHTNNCGPAHTRRLHTISTLQNVHAAPLAAITQKAPAELRKLNTAHCASSRRPTDRTQCAAHFARCCCE